MEVHREFLHVGHRGCTEEFRMVTRCAEGAHGVVARCMEGVQRVHRGHVEGFRMVKSN